MTPREDLLEDEEIRQSIEKRAASDPGAPWGLEGDSWAAF